MHDTNNHFYIWTHSYAGIILKIYIRCMITDMHIEYIFVYIFMCIYENKRGTFYLITWEYHVILLMHRYDTMAT